MKILKYAYESKDWKFHDVDFQNINLIVGDSGTGKTRFLNTLFNLGTFVAQRMVGAEGQWKLSLGIDENIYQWTINKVMKDDEVVIVKEELFLNEDLILERDENNINFAGRTLPKLSENELSVSWLREENLIKPLYDGFSTMLRRRFFGDELESNSAIVDISQKLLNRIGKKKDLYEIYKSNLSLNPRLYILSTYFPEIYTDIINYYKETFSFISDAALKYGHELESAQIPDGAPIFCIKERNQDKWIRLDVLSSGMQKVLLILVDLLSLPNGTIYLIDEYENSIGIGAINFLPNLLFSKDRNLQIFFTSHHPYIISNIPVDYWYIAHRNGTEVRFAHGKSLIDRYRISSQEKYIQLLNDPYYSEGVE